MGVPYIVHCQDLHPESARLVGRVPAGWLYDLLRRCDAIICRDAAAVVVLEPATCGMPSRSGVCRQTTST